MGISDHVYAQTSLYQRGLAKEAAFKAWKLLRTSQKRSDHKTAPHDRSHSKHPTSGITVRPPSWKAHEQEWESKTGEIKVKTIPFQINRFFQTSQMSSKWFSHGWSFRNHGRHCSGMSRHVSGQISFFQTLHVACRRFRGLQGGGWTIAAIICHIPEGIQQKWSARTLTTQEFVWSKSIGRITSHGFPEQGTGIPMPSHPLRYSQPHRKHNREVERLCETLNTLYQEVHSRQM